MALAQKQVTLKLLSTLGDSRFRLESPLMAVGFTNDGSLRTVEENGKSKKWKSPEGTLLNQTELDDLATLWCWNSTGELLASGGEELSIWQPDLDIPLVSVKEPSWITALAFSADSEQIAIGLDDGQLRLLSVKSLKGVGLPSLETQVSQIAFSQDGIWLAIATEDKQITLIDVIKQKITKTMKGHQDRITGVTWHPSGKYLATSAWDTTCRIWDVQKGEQVFILNGQGQQVHAAAFSPDGNLLATSDSHGVIWLWQPLTGKALHRLRGHHGEIQHLAFHSDGSLLVSGGTDGRLILWNTQTGENLLRQTAEANIAARVAFSREGNTLAAVLGGDEVFLGDGKSTNFPKELRGFSSPATTLCWDDRNQIWSGHMDGTLRKWNPQTGEETQTLSYHRQRVTALATNNKGNRIASAGGLDGYVFLWNSDAADPLLLIPEATQGCTVESLSFVPGTDLLLVAGLDWKGTSMDGTLAVWDLSKPALVKKVTLGCHSLAVHPKGKTAALASLSDSICIVDCQTLEVLHEWNEDQGAIHALAYHPNGDWLISGCVHGQLTLWDATSGDLISQLETPSAIRDIALSSDGKTLVVAHANDTCSLVTWE